MQASRARLERLLTSGRAWGLLPAVLLLGQPLGAQQAEADLRVRLEGAAGEPVSGALVALLRADGSVATEGLSSVEGRRTLRAPPGRYRVRVRRIGFFPFLSSEVTVPRVDELRITVQSQVVALEAVVVTARLQCRSLGEDSEALALVWSEIAKALRASQLTMQDLAGIGRARVYTRQTNLRGELVGQTETSFVVDDRRPFGAASPEVLAERGFVRGDEYSGWVYYAPDETVLLSESFLATHCFRVVRQPDRPGQLGVAFEPVPRRRRPDITGVLWVDEMSAELREVVFRYVNVGVASPFQPRGHTRFRRMPSGAWVVDEWQLRLPSVHRRPGAFSNIVLSGYHEHGGGILGMAADPADTTDSGAPAIEDG